MSEGSAETLFDEFALAYRRGERPDVLEYLARATEGPERDDLAGLIDRFLQATPARAPSDEEVALMRAGLEGPPLLVLRLARKLTRDAVVDGLVRALGLDSAKRDRVAAYYHELENGLLDPEPVDRSVWDALGQVLRANVRAFTGPRAAGLAAPAAAYRRLQDADFVLAEQAAEPEPPPSPPRPEERDEVDRLFTGSA